MFYRIQWVNGFNQIEYMDIKNRESAGVIYSMLGKVPEFKNLEIRKVEVIHKQGKGVS